MDKINLYLLSGFLGAGKTTLLQQLADQFPRNRLGVLVNEFGDLGVDGVQFRGDGKIKLVEISGGSIFCACLKDGFVRTLKAFSNQPIDTLLIENSGMADPAAMPKLLEGLRPYLKRDYAYKGNLCLVDGTTFFDYVDVLTPIRSQIATADVLIVNKIDLLDQQELEQLHRELAEINPDAPRMDTVFAQIPAEFLQNMLPGNRAVGAGSNTPQNRPAVFSLQAEGRAEAAQAEQFHGLLKESVIRFKGFLRAEQWLDVQAVGKRLTISPAPDSALEVLPEDGIRLVLICAPDSGLDEATIRNLWETCFPQSVKIRQS